MSKISSSFKFSATLIALCALAACGGGGGDSPAATTPAGGSGAGTSSSATPFTRADAEAIAGIGFITSELITLQAQLEQPALAFFAQGFLSANAVVGSSGPTTVGCASSAGLGGGTLSATVTKSGTYAGLKTNDKIDVTYNNCNFGSGIVQNGRLAITAQADYANLGALGAGFKFNYQLSSTNYQVALTTGRFVSNGVQNVQFDSTVSANYPKLNSTVISAYSYKGFNPASATTSSLEYSLNTGVALSSQLTSAGASYSSTVDGSVGLTVASNSVALAYTTPTPITGAVVSGRFIPAAGVLRVKETTANLQTESTVQGAMVQVKADTNRDGILDLTFSTTYSLLTN